MHETLHPNCPFYFYISRINNRLVIKKKTQCKLELQMPETMKLLGSAKNGEWRMKNGEYVQILEVLKSM